MPHFAPRTTELSMRSRIHDVLDEELPRSALSPQEAGELEAVEAACGRAVSALRDLPVPPFSARVLAVLPDGHASAPAAAGGLLRWLADALRWLWTPRPVAFRPAWAAASALAILVALPFLSGGERGGAPEDGAAARPSVYVQFRLDAPGASSVHLAGSFTAWSADHPLREVAPGVWSAVVPLEAGVHDYLFVVDGEQWLPDPGGVPVEDGFGGTNSRLFLTVPRTST
jgi:hypothetical protein